MIAGEGAEGVPGYLGVVVAMVVDEPRGDRHPLGVDDPMGAAAYFAYAVDYTVLYGNGSFNGRAAGAVDNPCVLDEQIVCHG